MRKGKIIDTQGPAVEGYDMALKEIKAGMDVARLNRSHGTVEEHDTNYKNLRKAAKEAGRNNAILVDIQGPKIRCSWFKKNAEGKDQVTLKEGQEFTIIGDKTIIGDETHTGCTYEGIAQDCHPGDPLLIDDGKVQLEVTSVEGNQVHTKVTVAGPVSSHKGINLPGVAVSLPALTEKDEKDLRWGVQEGADIIAMSFVRHASDIDRAHQIMDEEGRRVPIVAKIEKPQAVENLEEIVKTFDGIMVARGDMAVEMPFEQVPLVTRRCIELCRKYAKPVIVATEVLGSMVHSPIPTRAEASDCAEAILNGADATMTSNETAVGEYPIQTISAMQRISKYASDHGFNYIPKLDPKDLDLSNGGATALSAKELADQVNAKAIVTFTENGTAVHQISRLRPKADIYGFTTDVHNFGWITLSWGTTAMMSDKKASELTRDELLAKVDHDLKAKGAVNTGDQIVISLTEKGDLLDGEESVILHTVD